MADDVVDDKAAAGADASAETQEQHDAAFAEFAEKKDETTGKAPAEKPAPEADKTEAETTDAPAEGTEAAADAAAAADKKPTPEEEAAAKKAAAPKVNWDTATPEQRAAYDAAQNELQRVRSDLPRQSILAKRVNTLEAELAIARAGKTAPAASKDAPKPFSETPEGKKLLEDLPEVKSLVTRLDQADATARAANSGVVAQHERDRQAAYQAEDDAFLTVHPDFPDIKKSGKFGPWLQSKPKSIQDIAAKHTAIVTNAAEAIELVNMFKLENGIPLKSAVAEKKPATPTNLDSKRQAQLEAARAAPAQKGPDVANAASGEDALFSQFAAAKERKRG